MRLDMLHYFNQTFILFTYGEMAEIVYVRDANGNLVQTTIEDLREDRLEELEEENKKLKETIKDHQLYEEKLEHRIIEFEELLHGE